MAFHAAILHDKPGYDNRARCLIEKATQIKTDYPAATAIGGKIILLHNVRLY
jgi:hypothetical protein